MHGNSTQRSSLAGGVGMGEKLAMWCKEAKIQIASLVLQPPLLSDNEQRKSDQLFTVGCLWLGLLIILCTLGLAFCP